MNINELLSTAIGQEVARSRTGGAAGSVWTLRFKEEMGFMIYCAWRVECDNVVLTTSIDDKKAITGRMSKSVGKLVGKKLLSYELSKHYDLILHFEDNYLVRIFCNNGYQAEIWEDYPYPNWYFSVPSMDISFRITDYFQVVYTKYYSDYFINEE